MGKFQCKFQSNQKLFLVWVRVVLLLIHIMPNKRLKNSQRGVVYVMYFIRMKSYETAKYASEH